MQFARAFPARCFCDHYFSCNFLSFTFLFKGVVIFAHCCHTGLSFQKSLLTKIPDFAVLSLGCFSVAGTLCDYALVLRCNGVGMSNSMTFVGMQVVYLRDRLTSQHI